MTQERRVAVMLSAARVDHRAIESMDQLKEGGWHFVIIQRIADVALARNVALTEALNTGARIVLCLDDDIEITPEQAERLAMAASELGCPVSGIYMLNPVQVNYGRWAGDDPHERGWWCGCGCLAIPRECLLTLAEQSAIVHVHGRDAFVFTECKARRASFDDGDEAHEPRWIWSADDMTLCHRLGGVRIAPIHVAHHKLAALTPPDSLAPDLPLVELSSAGVVIVPSPRPE